ncbi:calcium homeostasis modulator protein 3-like [Bufo gargarizans]|uniref:calcium homeostasis modulator protein 3-like n=1 Tax=Bufo gargarizans TaxID=30331 RepID=UPI001CF1A7B4|nr:calcium homeostasis modulator protein 3-like [Bufo gargarizans]
MSPWGPSVLGKKKAAAPVLHSNPQTIMERAIKYFKSGSEAKVNGVCGLIILTSVIVYKIFEFKCPCIPGFNKPYALMVLLAPSLIFFFVGVLANKFCGLFTIEYSRPEGGRAKNKKVLNSFAQLGTLSALKVVNLQSNKWYYAIVVLIASSYDWQPVYLSSSHYETLDPDQYGGFAEFPEFDASFLLAKVPCKNFDLLRRSSTRKAISRFLKFLSQGIGYIAVLTIILIGALARFVLPLFTTHEALQSRYWTKYSDMEDKCFEEMCILHNYKVAEKCVKSYFEGTTKERKEEVYYDRRKVPDAPVETLVYVDQWYNHRPPIPGADLPDPS